MLKIQPISAFSDNYIWLIYDQQSGAAFVVDPGDSQPVIEALETLQLNLSGILITHHHFDHVGGLAQLRQRYDPVVYGPHNPAINDIDQRLAAGDAVTVLGREFQVLEVPGHTLDHIAFYAPGETPLLFCGDTLFAGGCGRLFEGTAPMMHSSLQILAALPGATKVYCAHEYTLANLAFAQAVEPDNQALGQRITAAQALRAQDKPTVPSDIALELATNPFLRSSTAMQDMLKSQKRFQGDAAVEVFAAVRGWKDSF